MDFTIKNKIICFTARRNSGKSQLLRYIVESGKKDFKAIFVICPTEEINSFYKGLVKPENVFSEYKEEWANDLIAKMTKLNSGKSDSDASHILLILDDCCSDHNFHQSKSLKVLFTRGRHLKISLMITAQYPYHIPPISRVNCDYILVGQLNQQGLELLCKEYLLGAISKQEFVSMYHENTSDYGFLVINNNSVKSNEDLDSIYGRLKVPPQFIKK